MKTTRAHPNALASAERCAPFGYRRNPYRSCMAIAIHTWCMSPRWNPNPDVRTGRDVVYNLHVHFVFVTKYRRKAMTDA